MSLEFLYFFRVGIQWCTHLFQQWNPYETSSNLSMGLQWCLCGATVLLYDALLVARMRWWHDASCITYWSSLKSTLTVCYSNCLLSGSSMDPCRDCVCETEVVKCVALMLAKWKLSLVACFYLHLSVQFLECCNEVSDSRKFTISSYPIQLYGFLNLSLFRFYFNFSMLCFV